MSRKDEQNDPGPHEKPVSLHPLSPEEALKKLLKAKPSHKQQDQSKPKKGRKGSDKKRGESDQSGE